MDTIKEQIFSLLTTRLGGDCDFNDYGDKDTVLDCAIEAVQEEDNLTQGCGAGPLMGHIEEWVDFFEKQTQNKSLSVSSKLKR